MSTFIELGVGFNPDLAARDNVILNGIMLGLTPAEARERYEQVIDFAELRDAETVKLKNYSSGMHVRLAFSVMIQVDADVLLIDEVLAVGDAVVPAEVLRRVQPPARRRQDDRAGHARHGRRTALLPPRDADGARDVVLSGDPERVGSRYLELNFHHDQETAAEQARTPSDRYGDGSARFVQLWTAEEDDMPLDVAPQGSTSSSRRSRSSCAHGRPAVGITIEDEDRRPVFADQLRLDRGAHRRIRRRRPRHARASRSRTCSRPAATSSRRTSPAAAPASTSSTASRA